MGRHLSWHNGFPRCATRSPAERDGQWCAESVEDMHRWLAVGGTEGRLDQCRVYVCAGRDPGQPRRLLGQLQEPIKHDRGVRRGRRYLRAPGFSWLQDDRPTSLSISCMILPPSSLPVSTNNSANTPGSSILRLPLDSSPTLLCYASGTPPRTSHHMDRPSCEMTISPSLCASSSSASGPSSPSSAATLPVRRIAIERAQRHPICTVPLFVCCILYITMSSATARSCRHGMVSRMMESIAVCLGLHLYKLVSVNETELTSFGNYCTVSLP
jgi:hypothetical protein